MNQRQIGKTGAMVSEMGFGAWAIGGTGVGFNYGPVCKGDATGALSAFIEAGGTHIDTARYYNESERIIGTILRDTGVRATLTIASKTFQNTRDAIRSELDESLRLLRTDYLDIYYLHMPPDGVGEMNVALDAMAELRDEGLVRAVGASIKGPNVTQATVDLCRQYITSGRVDVIQAIYSILRQKVRDVFDLALEHNVALVGRTALESGFLTGKYPPGHQFAEGDHRGRWGDERLSHVLGCVQGLGQAVVGPPYENLAEVAIRFAMAPKAIASTIVGGKNADQVRANLRALERPPLRAGLIARLTSEYGERTDELNGD